MGELTFSFFVSITCRMPDILRFVCTYRFGRRLPTAGRDSQKTGMTVRRNAQSTRKKYSLRIRRRCKRTPGTTPQFRVVFRVNRTWKTRTSNFIFFIQSNLALWEKKNVTLLFVSVYLRLPSRKTNAYSTSWQSTKNYVNYFAPLTRLKCNLTGEYIPIFQLFTLKILPCFIRNMFSF